MQVGYTVITA